jgi:hypothetical protein
MKRVRLILLLCIALLIPIKSRAADLVVSNNAIICLFGDSFWISDASLGYVTGYRFTDYLDSFYQLSYPGSNVSTFNYSRSGGTMDDVLTNRVQQLGLPTWGYQFNNYQHIGITLATDNGAESSNQMFLSVSNIDQAPALMSDGTSTLNTHTGWTTTNTIQWISCGYPPGAASDGSATGSLSEKARNDGATNGGIVFGIRGVDFFNILSNSWVSDWTTNSGHNVQMMFPSGIMHFESAGGLSLTLAFLRQTTTDTNISTCKLGWNSALPLATNHCYVSGINRRGYGLFWQRKDDRLPLAWDVPNASIGITNDATPAFILNPADADYFKYTIQVTDLPTGTYEYREDDELIGTYTDVQLAAGVNLTTNLLYGPTARQRVETLGRVRDKRHINRNTLAVNSADGNGEWSLQSAIGAYWGGANQFRGDALISSGITNNMANCMALNALTQAAAIPPVHNYSLIQVSAGSYPIAIHR